MSEPLLYVSDLSVRYSERQEVTTARREVSFSLGKEIVTIIGPSGSGKSSLLHALAGIIRPSKGTLQLSGVPLSPRTHQIALVPQQYARPRDAGRVAQPRAARTRQAKRLTRPPGAYTHDSIAHRSLRPLSQRTKWRSVPACSPCSCLHHEAGPASSRRSILSPRCSDGKSLSSALPRAVATLSYPHPLRHP